MDNVGRKRRDVTSARRGQIIQRIIVEGWSTAQAAAVFGLKERQVARWVAAYRRRGMASLREQSTEPLLLRWARRLQSVVGRELIAWRHRLGHIEAAPCVQLQRTSDRRRQR
ncbi:MAG TPA: helix-turn-helix domain-containing protein [Stellaceae bacterium]|jgi:transposase-like protein|nr:helix-turn-helix domain-containing protein [Stellaceae bacterium]